MRQPAEGARSVWGIDNRLGSVMAVKIKRERPDQRRHHRVTAPLLVEYGGHRIRAADWSLGGLRITGFPGALPAVGSALDLVLTLPFQGFDVTFGVKAEVVRIDPDASMFAARYTVLGERERDLMQHFIEELVRGSMSDVEDTIQRIDVPVTPASLQPDVAPATAAARLPVRRMPVKTIAVSAFYLVAGIAIFTYAAMLAYANLFRIEVQTAVISAPTETIVAQADGSVDWAGVKPGDPVRPGDVIVNLVDNQLEREIELADIAVRERKAQLVFLKQRYSDELDRARSYAKVEMKNVRQTQIELKSLEVRLQAAENQYKRMRHLHARGFTTDAKLEDAHKQLAELRAAMESRMVELASRSELAGEHVGKRLYTGDNIVGEVAQVEAQVDLAEREVSLAEQRYMSYLNHRERLAVRAPFAGKVVDLPRVDRAPVRRGDVVAVVERSGQREVAAYLTQDEVLRVGLGDEASIYIPALGETVAGRVAAIDRTSGFLREQDQRKDMGYSWRAPTDRSAKVTIEFADPVQVEDRQRYRPGLPVVVVLERRSASSVVGALSQSLSDRL